jgi:ABC-type nickel/cobalt efflux system permease component RcnA
VIVLLGATAIGRAWFGVALVVAYGIGMAATLLAAGLLLVWARRRYELRGAGERVLRIATVLPFVTAIAVTGGGVLLVVRAAAAI